jgi:hypothetical protein
MNNDTITEQEYVDVLRSLGFKVEKNNIHLSDELPIMSPISQKAIDCLCRNYDYECKIWELDR